MKKRHTVTFLPENKVVEVGHLKTLFEAMADEQSNAVCLRFACGSEGICQKCKIRAFHRMGPLTPTEKGCLADDELKKGVRLACQARVIQDMQAEILFKMPFTIELTEEVLTDAASLQPRIQKIYIPADGQAGLSTVRAAAALAQARPGTDSPAAIADMLAGRFGAFFQGAQQDGTAVFIADELVGLESGDTRQQQYAAAVDLGTNTLMVSLVDICTGTKIASVTDTNPQLALGATFESRIHMIGEDPFCLELLNEEMLLRIDILIGELCRARAVSAAHVYEIAILGGTGMLNLFLRSAPGLLDQRPGEGAVSGNRLRATDLDLKAPPQAIVHALPVMAPYVGADVTAGILATQLHRSPETALLIDLGTTIKAVLHHQGRVVAAGVPGGEAFECVGIHFGMRPEAGAIEGVAVADDLQLAVIGESLPRGICGSGLLDLTAVLKRSGLLDDAGIVQGYQGQPSAFLPLRKRIITLDSGQPAVVVYADASEFQSTLYVAQDDVVQLGRARACLNALLAQLIGHVRIGWDQLARVIISGACGRRMSIDALAELGFIPPRLACRTLFVGNTAKRGAQMALLDKRILDEAEHLVRHVECLAPPACAAQPAALDFTFSV